MESSIRVQKHLPAGIDVKVRYLKNNIEKVQLVDTKKERNIRTTPTTSQLSVNLYKTAPLETEKKWGNSSVWRVLYFVSKVHFGKPKVQIST